MSPNAISVQAALAFGTFPQVAAATRDYLAISPVPVMTYSSARARGAARNNRYWGAVQYHATTRKCDGVPIWQPCHRARSDRRTRDGAASDARATAAERGILYVPTARRGAIGPDELLALARHIAGAQS